jgi:hypothetical protein
LIEARALILFSRAREIRPMMGEQRVMQEALFYGFSLERRVPDDPRIWGPTIATSGGPRLIPS